MAEAPKGAGPTLLTTANVSQTIYTAPSGAGTWALVREITIVNETGALVVVTYGKGTSNTDAAGKRLLKSRVLQPGDDPWSWGGIRVLAGGATPDLLYAVCDTANGATVTLDVVEGP